MARARETGPRAVAMTARPVPRRHWRSYGDDKLPTGAAALDEPFSAFPSWGSCASPATAAVRSGCSQRPMRHSATCCSATSSRRCVTTAAAAGLTDIAGASSRPVRRIVLIEG
jgi:hypothetical protein